MFNIIFLGMISFFTDLSSEMVYPLIPIYLTSVMGATPAIIGIIEGIAESMASLLKVYSGYISDKYKKKKKIAFLGYSCGMIYKILLIVSTSWIGILIARMSDRFGKGIRTAPRDVMISDCIKKGDGGKVFGIHKMLDMAGSALGIIIVFFIMKYLGRDSYKTVFILSLIPMFIALIIFVFIKEKKVNEVHSKREPFWINIKNLDKSLKLYLLIVFLFTLGNSSNAFLILRATNVGFSGGDVIILYFLYNVIASIFAIPFGKMSDKKGRKKILIFSYLIFSFVYLLFAFALNSLMIISAFIIYGLYTAMITGGEKAFISEISPKELKGTMLGLHGSLTGIALLPASIIAGFLWTKIGGYAPFVFGSLLSFASAIILLIGFDKIKNKELLQ